MLKFLLKEVRANSSGSGTRGHSISGKGTKRKSEVGDNQQSTRAEGKKRSGLTSKKKGRKSDIM